MKKYLVFIPAILLLVGGAGFFIWAHSGHDHADYPDAKEYAPNFWFDSEEKYYPADPLDFYFDAKGDELSGKTAVSEYDKLSLDEKLEKVKVFYNINDAGAEIVYQYWLFYVMNNYENGHYGDWESVFVFVDKESKNVNKAVGSAHGSGHVLKIKSEDTRHIWAYVGNGSHANCPDEQADGTCNFFAWNLGRQGEDWTQEDIERGRKLAYTDYPLFGLGPSYTNSFQSKKSFDKQKSPTLGLNPYKVLKLDKVNIPFLETKEEKYINPPIVGNYFGKTPTFAWTKEEYHNPQKVLVSARTKIANNIGGFFKNTGNFIAAIGRTVVSPVASLLTAQVGSRASPGGEAPVDSTDSTSSLQASLGQAGGLTPTSADETTSDVRGFTPRPRGLTPTPIPAEPETEIALVTRVIDGDTVELASGQRVRYIGIDAPELPDICFAQEATEKNKELAQNKQIILLGGPTDTDIYGRLLRFAWQDVNLSGAIDSPDIFVNVALVEGGYAHSADFGENHAYSHRFEAAEAKAKRERQGLWGDACLPAEASAKEGNPKEDEVTLEKPKPIVRMYEPPNSVAPSTAPIDLTAPTSTIAVANYAIDNPEFQIQWSTNADDLDYYEAQYKIGNSGAWQAWGSATTTATSKNYLNATTSTYYFRVRGTDIHQNIGPWQESQGVVIDLYQVVINEIQINDAEFVELYNLGSSTTSLSGYYFSYYPSTRTLWNDPFRNKKFLDSASIGGGGYYLIGLKDYATSTGNPKADWQPYTSAQLSSEKGTIAIFPFDPASATTSQYAYDNRIDAIGWGSGISLYEGVAATTIPAVGQSLTRNSNHTDTDNNASDFTVATSTTPTNSSGETYVPPPPPVNPVWAMYQKDARHSGLATLAGPSWTSSAQATSTWIFPMDSAGSSPPVIDGLGIIYAMDGEGKVYALNVNGTQKWKFDPKIQGGNGAGWASASPALSSDGSRVYSTYTDTSVNKLLVLYSINTSDGSLAWKYSVTGVNETFTSPVLDSAGNVYVASNSKLYSISPAVGSLRWEFTPISQFSSFALWIRTPAIAQEGQNEYAYITAQMSNNGGDRYIFKVDVSNGIQAWQSNADMGNALVNGISINATGTIYTGGYLFIGKSGLFAVHPTDGSKVWSNNMGDSLASNIPSYDTDGNIFLGTEDTGNIGALHKTNATGTLLWSFYPDSNPSAAQFPSVVDGQGRVYVGAKNKFIYALKPEDGSVIWKYQLADEPRGFAIGNGRVYVVSYDGKIYAL